MALDTGLVLRGTLAATQGPPAVPDGSIGTDKLADGAVTTPKIANGAVTGLKLSDNSVGTGKISSKAVTGDKLADGSVGNAKIANGSVTNEKLAAGSVSNEKLAEGAVTDDKLAQDGGVLSRVDRLLYRLSNMLTATPAEAEAVTVADAAQTPMAGLALYGKSTQDGTPTPEAPVAIESVRGNLLPNNGSSATSYGVTFTVNADGSVTCSGTATTQARFDIGRDATTLPAGTYICGEGEGSGYIIDVYKVVDGTATRIRSGFGTFTLDAETSVFVRIVVASGATVSATISPYIYRGSVPYPFVPYGNAGLWSQGRNLWPTVPSTTTAGITIAVAEDGTVTLNGTATSTVNHIVTVTIPETGSYVLSGCPSGGGSSTYQLWTFDQSTPADPQITDTGNGGTGTLTAGHQITLRIRVQSGYTCNNVVMRPMLRLASADAAYVPYTESVTLIPLDGHELRSLPDGTRDELTVDGRGHAVLVQRVGSVTLDGSETWTATNAGTTGTPRYRTTLAGLVGSASIAVNAVVQYLQCDHFPVVCDSYSNKGTYNGETGVSPRRTDDHEVWFFHEGETLDNWKTWLASNPVTIDYKLATQQFIDLGTIDPVPLCGPDLTAQAIPTAPFALTYERDLNATLARLESALATLA